MVSIQKQTNKQKSVSHYVFPVLKKLNALLVTRKQIIIIQYGGCCSRSSYYKEEKDSCDIFCKM